MINTVLSKDKRYIKYAIYTTSIKDNNFGANRN